MENKEQQHHYIDAQELVDKDYGSVLEKRRWLILASFCIFSASNAMLWITYSPINNSAQEYYRIEKDQVLEFSDSYMYIYFLLSFLGSWLSYKWFTVSLLGAMGINTFGAWLRYFAGQSFPIALTGQYFAALAQNVVLFVPVLIADRWFAARERNWVVTIAVSSNLVGWGFGFMFPTVLVQDGPSKITDVLFYEAIISLAPVFIGIFCIRERPKVPPSYSALVKLTDHSSYWKELRDILKNIKFVLVTTCFGNLLGQSYTLSSVIVIFMPNSSLIEQGSVGVVFIACGIIGSIIGTMYLSKSKSDNYDLLLRILMIISMLGLVSLAFVIKSENMLWIYLLNGLLGVGLLGFQPFACQTLVEMTFPVQEAISVNLMMVMGQLFGLIGNSLSTSSWVEDKGLWSLSALVSPCVLYIVLFHKTETKRKQAEEQHKKMDQQAVTSMIEEEELHNEDTESFFK